jgi:dihydroorotase-like cyclic amidohydrolase
VSKAKYTPFEGVKLRTATAATYVRGQLVYHERVFAEKAVGMLVSLE